MKLQSSPLPPCHTLSIYYKISVVATQRHKTEDRAQVGACDDLFIWFGGPLHKRFQGSEVCCLLLPQTIGCYWLLLWSNPVSIGFHRNQTNFQSSALYLWALGKHCFVKRSSSTLCCTVFLSNFFGRHLGRQFCRRLPS